MKRLGILIIALVAGLTGLLACTTGPGAPTATSVVLVVTATPVPTATLPPGAATPTPKPTGAVASPTAPAALPTVELSGLTHEVKAGETLSSIARMYGVSADSIAKANNISDPNLIKVGQKLVLPKGATPPPPTATPTNTPVVPPTATPTHTPAATPTPAATATPSPTPTPPYAFRLDAITTYPNCGLTSIKGYIRDANGNGLADHTVKVTSVPATWSVVSGLTSSDGYYDVIIANEPKAGTWQVWVIGVNDTQLSPVVTVETNTSDCLPSGAGKQVYQVDFKRN